MVEWRSRFAHAPVAQGIERWVADPKAAGSNPARRTSDSPPGIRRAVLLSAPPFCRRLARPRWYTSRVGEVSEWLKVPLSKSGEVMSLRGFESHPLRHGRVA